MNAQVMLHNRLTGVTRLISRNGADAEGNGESSFPSISGDGRVVVFSSEATNIDSPSALWSDIYIHDVQANQTRRVDSVPGTVPNGSTFSPAVNENGEVVALVSR